MTSSIVPYSKIGSFSVSEIKWSKVPIEASGIYECYDSTDGRIPVGRIDFVIPSNAIFTL